MSDDNITPPAPPVSPAYAAPVAGAKKGLSLTSFILGLASIVLFITSWFAVLLGIGAVVLGFIGRSKEPGAPRWMALVGIITGFVGIVLGVIVIVVTALFLSAYNSQVGQ